MNRRGFIGALIGGLAARNLPVKGLIPPPIPAPVPTLCLDEFQARYIAPAMMQIANNVDLQYQRAFDKALNEFNANRRTIEERLV